jgi:hypothetical protein
MGASKTALYAELAAAYTAREYTFKDAKTLPSFEYRAYMRLYNAGLLRFSKRGGKRLWRVINYTPWSQAQPSSGGTVA